MLTEIPPPKLEKQSAIVDTTTYGMHTTNNWRQRHAAKKRRRMIGITPKGVTDTPMTNVPSAEQ